MDHLIPIFQMSNLFESLYDKEYLELWAFNRHKVAKYILLRLCLFLKMLLLSESDWLCNFQL